MGRKLTTEGFIEKSKLVHGNKYNYSKVVYINAHNKVSIICEYHGFFNQSPNSHLRGSGCPECASISTSKKLKLTTNQFIEKSKRVHGDRYDYSLVDYKNNYTKVKIICKKHGEFFQSPNSHLNGSNGCNMCICKRLYTAGEFVAKSIIVHGNKYDYSLVDYKGANSKLTIICKIHSEFKQTAGSHLNGNGCPKCANIKTKKRMIDTPNGWSISNWDDSALKSKKFDSFKVYIIKCYNDNESFYKIGRTYTTTKTRFRSFIYKYEIIKEFIFNTAKEAFDYESKLKREHKKFKYIPMMRFDGKSECFSKINLQV